MCQELNKGQAHGFGGGTALTDYVQQGIQTQTKALAGNPPRCECHECTQARWKMQRGY